jgi:hypothetical protein
MDVGRERMHESCIDLSQSAAPEVRRRGSWKPIDGAAGLRILRMTCGSCARAIDALCVVPASDEAAAAAIGTA